MEAQQILAQLERAGLIAAESGWTLERASGGLNTTVWLLTDGDGKPCYSVRIGPAAGVLEHEARAISTVAGCPGVPTLRFVSPQLLVHDYLPGEVNPLAELNGRQIDALARSLACLHSHRHAGYVLWPDRALHLGQRIGALHGRTKRLEQADLSELPELREVRDQLSQLVASLDSNKAGWQARDFSQLHGDLSIGNLLWTADEVGLIDWEYARAGDPAEELAYLITEQPVTQAIIDQLKASYLAAGGTPDVWQRLPTWAAFTATDSAVWWVNYLRAQGERPHDHPTIWARIVTARQWLSELKSS